MPEYLLFVVLYLCEFQHEIEREGLSKTVRSTTNHNFQDRVMRERTFS